MQSAVIRLTLDMKIGLIIWGEDGELEYGGTTKNKNTTDFDISYLKNEKIEGDYAKFLKRSKFRKEDLHLFKNFPQVMKLNLKTKINSLVLF